MTFDEYRAIEAINFSTLKHMDHSPLHYRRAVDEGDGEETTSRAKLRLNHALILEPEKFALEFAVWTGEGTRTSKAYKEWEPLQGGRTCIKRDEYERAIAIRDAVLSHSAAGRLLTARGESEVTLLWTDDATGLPCKARVDRLRLDDDPAIIDVKGYGTVEEFAFGQHAKRMHYHWQIAHYQNGYAANHAGRRVPCYLVAYEIRPPHDVAVFEVGKADMADGREKVRELLSRVADCRASGKWPGRYSLIRDLMLPVWSTDDDGFEVVDNEENAA